jgi:hypothetical protein
MECLACGLRAGYNRVVVERPSGTELGGLCVECEERRFGDCLLRGLWTETDGCALCTRDVYAAMPAWYPETERSPDGLLVRNDYEVTDGTVGLCGEHLESLIESDSQEEERSPTLVRSSE